MPPAVPGRAAGLRAPPAPPFPDQVCHLLPASPAPRFAQPFSRRAVDVPTSGEPIDDIGAGLSADYVVCCRFGAFQRLVSQEAAVSGQCDLGACLLKRAGSASAKVRSEASLLVWLGCCTSIAFLMHLLDSSICALLYPPANQLLEQLISKITHVIPCHWHRGQPGVSWWPVQQRGRPAGPRRRRWRRCACRR